MRRKRKYHRNTTALRRYVRGVLDRERKQGWSGGTKKQSETGGETKNIAKTD